MGFFQFVEQEDGRGGVAELFQPRRFFVAVDVAGLLDADLMEPPLERGVALDALVILGPCRRADYPEPPTGERRLEDVRRNGPSLMKNASKSSSGVITPSDVAAASLCAPPEKADGVRSVTVVARHDA